VHDENQHSYLVRSKQLIRSTVQVQRELPLSSDSALPRTARSACMCKGTAGQLRVRAPRVDGSTRSQQVAALCLAARDTPIADRATPSAAARGQRRIIVGSP